MNEPLKVIFDSQTLRREGFRLQYENRMVGDKLSLYLKITYLEIYACPAQPYEQILANIFIPPKHVEFFIKQLQQLHRDYQPAHKG